MNYYNEIDPKVAEWLRNLIAAGVIAPGEVDNRSIEDVTPDDLAGFTQCHFFAGIGVWSYALRRAGWRDDEPVWSGSCPCQPFSAAGKGGGFDDERHLWPAWEWLIARAKPRGVPVVGEQVASKAGLAWLDIVSADLEGQGYTVRAADLCAAGVGAPHIRQRLFFVADTDGGDASAEGLQRGGQHGFESQDGRARSRLADDDTAGRSEQRRARLLDGKRQAQRDDADGRGANGGVADDADGRRGEGRARRSRHAYQGNGSADGRIVGNVSRLENAECAESARFREHGGPRIRFEEAAGLTGSGGTRGWWRDADWIYCTDQKYRPVEPGTFPLAHGATARVVRLRAYGNAIVAPLAEEFIRAYLDVRGLALT